ncbi:MAG TPA: hypothetical protein VK461_12790, partial [Acidimicrobiales bacterium]|nr:hypothetical protein [Acidimicrobiales bacterium]
MVEGAELGEQVRPTTRRRLALSLIFVGLVALGVAWAGDPRAASFSDAGARLATTKTMADEGRWAPDLGYWAADVDPTGSHHPILFAQPHDDQWVAVPSLPLVVAGRPFWQLGGARVAVLIPVLSVVLAAYAARRLSRWVSRGDGWLAFWFVGLLSPVLFYGADFWEHAPALALGLLAVALVLEGGLRKVLIGGAIAGLAVAMRNDMLATFAALGVAALLVPEERRRCLQRWRELGAGCAALLAVVFANTVIEHFVLAPGTGSARAGGRVSILGAQLADRLRDAVITSVGVLANDYWLALAIGAVIGLGILLLAAGAADRSGDASMPGVVGAVVAWGGMAWRFATFGVSTVPGFLCAAPVAALGFFGERTRREQVLFLGAVIAIPTVWMTEWVGGHAPQWGGRYLLLPTSLLIVLAASQVARLGARPLVVALLGLSAVMSVIGVVWHIDRTRSVARFAQDVMAVPNDVVVIGDQPWMGSEIGTWYGDRRFLSARAADDNPNDADPEDVVTVVGVAREAGATQIDVIDSDSHALDRIDENPSYDGFRFESVRTTKFLWTDVVIRR